MFLLFSIHIIQFYVIRLKTLPLPWAVLSAWPSCFPWTSSFSQFLSPFQKAKLEQRSTGSSSIPPTNTGCSLSGLGRISAGPAQELTHTCMHTRSVCVLFTRMWDSQVRCNIQTTAFLRSIVYTENVSSTPALRCFDKPPLSEIFCRVKFNDTSV